MKDRLKNLEIEVAYLRKSIIDLSEFIRNLEIDNHFYYTNVFYTKDYLDKLTEKYNKE